jgi:hypothetical protein
MVFVRRLDDAPQKSAEAFDEPAEQGTDSREKAADRFSETTQHLSIAFTLLHVSSGALPARSGTSSGDGRAIGLIVLAGG